MQYIDILVLTETKLDNTFPVAQFLVNGFSGPYKLDKNRNGRKDTIQIRQDIPCKPLAKHVFSYNMQVLFVELNFKKCKWLVFGTNHPSA